MVLSFEELIHRVRFPTKIAVRPAPQTGLPRRSAGHQPGSAGAGARQFDGLATNHLGNFFPMAFRSAYYLYFTGGFAMGVILVHQIIVDRHAQRFVADG